MVKRMQARDKLKNTESQFSDTMYTHGVDKAGFGIIRSRGDAALFGGHNTETISKLSTGSYSEGQRICHGNY